MTDGTGKEVPHHLQVAEDGMDFSRIVNEREEMVVKDIIDGTTVKMQMTPEPLVGLLIGPSLFLAMRELNSMYLFY